MAAMGHTRGGHSSLVVAVAIASSELHGGLGGGGGGQTYPGKLATNLNNIWNIDYGCHPRKRPRNKYGSTH